MRGRDRVRSDDLDRVTHCEKPGHLRSQCLRAGALRRRQRAEDEDSHAPSPVNASSERSMASRTDGHL
jgi:hypothetical protein